MSNYKVPVSFSIAVIAATLLVAVVSSAPGNGAAVGECTHSSSCRESSVNCSRMGNQLLCVYKSVLFVKKPRVFVNEVLLLANNSQVKETQLRGAYENVTGYHSCDLKKRMTFVRYTVGTLLITPKQLPATVEISFTKNAPANAPFIEVCGYDALPTLSYTFEEPCLAEQSHPKPQCSSFPNSAVNRNLVKTASLLADINQRLAEMATC